MTGSAIAAALGVSRKTVYRWLDEGRLTWPRDRADLDRQRLTTRPRGPRRDPWSVRYRSGRHSFDEVRGTR